MTRRLSAQDVAIAAAVNDHDVLAQCLASSPDIVAGAVRLKIYESFTTAGRAYNAAIAAADGAAVLVLAHQDVYLPRGFLDRLLDRLHELDAADPLWAVAGVIGAGSNGKVVGRTWSSGMARLVGSGEGLPAPVQSLDEMILVVRTDARLMFDPQLPSFHLYGTDIVQVARAAGRSAYAIDLPVIHHSRPVAQLGGGYRTAYRYLQKKWRAVLPIPNPIVPVTRSILPLLIRDLRWRIKKRGRTTRAAAQGHPADIARAIGFDGDG